MSSLRKIWRSVLNNWIRSRLRRGNRWQSLPTREREQATAMEDQCLQPKLAVWPMHMYHHSLRPPQHLWGLHLTGNTPLLFHHILLHLTCMATEAPLQIPMLIHPRPLQLWPEHTQLLPWTILHTVAMHQLISRLTTDRHDNLLKIVTTDMTNFDLIYFHNVVCNH